MRRTGKGRSSAPVAPRECARRAGSAARQVQAAQLPVAVLLDEADLALAVLQAHRGLGLVAVELHVGDLDVLGLVERRAAVGKRDVEDLLAALLLAAAL